MRILQFLYGVFTQKQCCDMHRLNKHCTAYCIKTYGHFGNHQAWAGKEWK